MKLPNRLKQKPVIIAAIVVVVLIATTALLYHNLWSNNEQGNDISLTEPPNNNEEQGNEGGAGELPPADVVVEPPLDIPNEPPDAMADDSSAYVLLDICEDELAERLAHISLDLQSTITASRYQVIARRKDGTVVATFFDLEFMDNAFVEWRNITAIADGVQYPFLGLHEDGTVVAVGLESTLEHGGIVNGVANWTDIRR
ncbi:MAG: hypothetical protein LBC96_04625 [Lachnospiraceae bacterium]|jgi:hypothetical protein|nr:hypothetical protein [Lachnospiraceae bacterium]